MLKYILSFYFTLFILALHSYHPVHSLAARILYCNREAGVCGQKL